jgi:phospholipase/carboxylesterase
MQDMRREKFANLEVVLAGGRDREGGGDGPLVVLLHGFGAPGEDLVGLWRVMDVPEDTRFAFPAAPLTLEGGYDGRAWWMIDMMAMQMAMMQGRVRDLANEVPTGLAEARAQLNACLDALTARLQPKKLVLGGFSQGAMLSLDVALRSQRELAGVVLLSGTLLCESEWLPLMPARKALPIYQSHGTHDQILPFAAAERLRDHLTSAGIAVDFVSFRGQHEIPPRVLAGLGGFLTRCLASPQQ